MPIYFDPRVGSSSGMGNFATAAGLFDQFLGTGSKIREQQLKDATNSVQLHANELAKSNVDRQTFEGGLTSFGQASTGLRKPTTEMSPEEYQQWYDLHSKNGVKDFDGAANAWNRTMLSNFGKLSVPQGGTPTEFQTGANGITAGGFVLPKDLQQPAQAGAQPSAAPAPSGAQPGTPQVPNLTPGQMFNPVLRQVHQYQLETAGKEQELQKNQRELELGTPEEQKSRRDFSTSAAELSHNLATLEDTVKRNGNFEWWNEKDSSKLNLLPKQIAENWKHVNNPGGSPLKPGQEDKAAESLIPMPGAAGPASPVRNSITLSAIQDNRDLLAAKIREHENDPSTRLPVLGLDPALRSQIGMPPQRLVDNLRAQGKDVSNLQSSPDSGSGQQFGSMNDFLAAQKSGKTDSSQPATIGGRIYVYSQAAGGWVPQDQQPEGQTSTLPPVNLSRARAPQ